jgi:hypothetical protein
MEVSGHLHVSAALPRGKNLWYPLNRPGGPQSWYGCYGEELQPVDTREETEKKKEKKRKEKERKGKRKTHQVPKNLARLILSWHSVVK